MITDEDWLPDGGTWDGCVEYVLPCPGCEREKFSWNTAKRVGHCFRCGFSLGGIRQLRLHFGIGSAKPKASPSFRTPGRGNSDPYLPAEYNPVALAYLNHRGVDLALTREVGIMYSEGRVWFPCASPLGLSPFYFGRDVTGASTIPWKAFPAEKGKYIFGKVPTGDTVILLEGVMDVMSSGLWGRGVALLGSHPSIDILTWVGKRYSRVLLWLDPDEAGMKGRDLIFEVFRGWFPECVVYSIVSTKRDQHGNLCDPGNHTPEEANALLEGM